MYYKDIIDVRITDILTEWLIRDEKLEFFGQLGLLTNIKELNAIPTMGVWISASGFNLGYNKRFLDKLTKEELKFVLIHEFMHLISKHYERTKQFNLEHKLANVAQDMIINTEILEQYKKTMVKMPDKGLLMTEDYDDLRISELVYEYLKSDKFKENNPEMAKGVEQIVSNEQMDVSGLSEEELDALLDKLMGQGQFDVHLENETSDEIASEISKGVVDSLRTRGLLPKDVENYLERIKPRKKDYLSKIKKAVNGLSGSSKNDTYKRINRRSIPGKKGFVREGVGINVLLDVSGSMDGLIEYVLGYCFQNNLLLNVIQVDARVQSVEQFKSKKELSKIKIKGYGGTELQPGVDFVAANPSLCKLNTLILTDGYCDSLNFEHLHGKQIIISAGVAVKYVNGNVTQIVVDPEDIKRDMKK
jgi:predicted metal-dependent peptidase